VSDVANSDRLSFPEFARKWQKSKLRERSGSHSHFIDLCDVLRADAPTDVDVDGSTYTFDKGAEKNTGEEGFADVWKRGYFGWEYKSKNKDLADAYQQLLKYREALDNPPLLVVCDFDNFEVHTNWTNTAPEVYKFNLQDLLQNEKTEKCKVPPQDVFHALFSSPEKLKPGETPAQVTERAAVEFAKLAQNLHNRGISAEETAHYVMRLLFCLFAEDIRLLKDNPFRTLIHNNCRRPDKFVTRLRDLFDKMSKGGNFGADEIPYFDGGLFLDDRAHYLTEEDLDILSVAAKLNWAGIEPNIFGTLFERILNPDKRELGVGAKYTSVEDIERIVSPVLIEPLRREWADVQGKVTEIIAQANSQKKVPTAKALLKIADELLREFLHNLTKVKILDPACGSGNFLYVALKHLLDLEKEVSIFAWNIGMSGFLTQCHPSQLFGIEGNTYAHKVASVAVWIGYLQWHQQNGMPLNDNPVMQPLDNIQQRDAVLQLNVNGSATEPDWPIVDVIIGNPPFVGDKLMRETLGDEYVEKLRSLYSGRIPGGSDYVCYWFEKSRAMIETLKARRVGLLATQGIRGGRNRIVLDRIVKTGKIFWAESDRDWILEGAAVHVSMVAFDRGSEPTCVLNGNPVAQINCDLTATVNVTTAQCLRQNAGLGFIGTQKGGAFDLPLEVAKEMLKAPLNPNGKPNSDVVRPWINAADVTGRRRERFIIDFGTDTTEADAALYEKPFEYVVKKIKAKRMMLADRDSSNANWWRHQRSRPEMRQGLKGKTRFIVTPRHSKHRVFNWEPIGIVPDSALVVFARDDDYFFGVLHSKVHELWARRKGTQVREVESGFRYTPTSTFETFPMPWVVDAEPRSSKLLNSIAVAARQLVKKRDLWLNPPGASAKEMKKRTLTELYNQSATWLKDAHRELDDAVLAAYGWTVGLSDEQILINLLNLNAERVASEQQQGALQFGKAHMERKKVAGSVGSKIAKRRAN
jgi:type II restriction/modification system DNA methylase subunit YeeA